MWKREVARALALRLAEPKLEGVERLFFAARTDHFDKGRGAADERSPAGRLVRVFRKRAHERQVDVNVRIDEAGEDILPGRVDHLGVVRRVEVAVDLRDRFVFAKNVGDVAVRRRDNLAILDQDAH